VGIRDLTVDPAWRAAILARFDAEMRRDPPAVPGVRYERSDDIVRARGTSNWIVWWSLTADDAPAVAAREARTFALGGASLEWKLYAHDEPPNMAAALQAAGFVAEESETLMVCDLAQQPSPCDAPAADGIEFERVTDRTRLGDLAEVSSLAFERDMSAMVPELAELLFAAAPSVLAYVAYRDGAPVAGGRLELTPGRSFAGLWGGATVPAARRAGIFSALVGLRCRVARDAGYRFVTVDARETSRPILARLGFVALTTIVGWVLPGGDDVPLPE
jgi:hypothetical protein